jgi:glycerol-3-phosphate acyltransferase PlsY
MNIIIYIGMLILAYLLGSIPTAVWIGKWFWGVDVRKKGSGNAGATNTLRVLGWKAGVPVLIFDAFKGWLSIQLPEIFGNDPVASEQLINLKILLGVMVVLGHIFPLFAGFKGGKGVATLFGIGIALYPLSVLLVVAVFIVTLLLSGFVSLGSLIASVAFPFIDIFLFNQQSISLMILAIAVGIFVPITHRKNIGRLIRGEESRFSVKKKQS